MNRDLNDALGAVQLAEEGTIASMKQISSSSIRLQSLWLLFYHTDLFHYSNARLRSLAALVDKILAIPEHLRWAIDILEEP
jgi:hypothetical protein